MNECNFRIGHEKYKKLYGTNGTLTLNSSHMLKKKDGIEIEFQGKKIALTICEDIWDIAPDPMYVVNPMDELMKQNPTLMVNIAASPFDYNHAEERRKVMQVNAAKYNLPLAEINGNISLPDVFT